MLGICSASLEKGCSASSKHLLIAIIISLAAFFKASLGMVDRS